MTHNFLDVIKKELKEKSLDNKHERFFKSFKKKITLIDDTIRRYEASVLAWEMEDEDEKIRERFNKSIKSFDNRKILDELDESINHALLNADLSFDERYELSKNVRSRNVLRKTINTEKQDIKNFRSFLSEAYRVPDEPRDVLSHLNTLFRYHIEIGPISYTLPKNIGMRMDFVTILLMQAGASDPVVIEGYGRTYDRLRKSKKTKTKKKLESKQKVLETYHEIQNRADRKPNQIASIIYKKLGEKSPSISSIKRYLNEDGLI